MSRTADVAPSRGHFFPTAARRLPFVCKPGAGRTEVVGRDGDASSLGVAVPPTGNRANDAVVALVAKEFNLSRADVSVISGASSRQKRMRLAGVDVTDAVRAVDRLLANVRR